MSLESSLITILTEEEFHPSDHICSLPLEPFKPTHVCILLVKLDAVLQVKSHESWAEGENPFPQPSGHLFLSSPGYNWFSGLPVHYQLILWWMYRIWKCLCHLKNNSSSTFHKYSNMELFWVSKSYLSAQQRDYITQLQLKELQHTQNIQSNHNFCPTSQVHMSMNIHGHFS